jgi:hypothetical protein
VQEPSSCPDCGRAAGRLPARAAWRNPIHAGKSSVDDAGCLRRGDWLTDRRSFESVRHQGETTEALEGPSSYMNALSRSAFVGSGNDAVALVRMSSISSIRDW